ncbi:MAG: NAD(P)/FAD-dependent oxidoreductase [Gammaproteobacteria bacterium]|nr:MAG: NAD(P)/FAD-dependent oxidoreductase [Gammaproteobacteria bacterium]
MKEPFHTTGCSSGERVKAMASSRTLEIVGAGPAGLSAALAARASGAEVTVFEKRPDVGARFHGDFQGLENWTSETDVLAELESLGIKTGFDHTPVYEIVCFDPSGVMHTARSAIPIFYLVRRGSGHGTLDQALKAQALEAGVMLRFGERRRRVPNGGVVAEGPHRADVIAAGYVFETDMADGCYAAISNRLAPGGYSYLLIDKGRGTVATCMFERFHDERQCLAATVDFFEREVGLRWRTRQRYGGSGNFQRVDRAVIGERRYVGESAGFQDALFGFGLRYAFLSGHLAGSIDGPASAYEQAWVARLAGLNAASVCNRWLYERLGDRGRRAVLGRAVAGRDPRRLLQRIYSPKRWKTALARWLPNTPLLSAGNQPANCDCTWCRCHRHTPPPSESGV